MNSRDLLNKWKSKGAKNLGLGKDGYVYPLAFLTRGFVKIVSIDSSEAIEYLEQSLQKGHKYKDQEES